MLQRSVIVLRVQPKRGEVTAAVLLKLPGVGYLIYAMCSFIYVCRLLMDVQSAVFQVINVINSVNLL